MADITLNLQGNANLDDGSQQISPASIAKTLSVLDRQAKYLALGNNAIAVPKNGSGVAVTSYCLIIFNAGNSTSIYTLKGVNGDTGIILPTTPGFALVPTAADFVINSSHADTIPTEFIFF